MGRDKASLPFGEGTLLERVIARLRPVVQEIVVVGPEGIAVPPGVVLVHDRVPGQGPLGGIAAGLAAVRASYAFVTACDAPFLAPELVRGLLDLAHGYEATVPVVADATMPLAAVYGFAALPVVERMLEAGDLRARALAGEYLTQVQWVEEAALRRFDPALASFSTCNTPEEYRAALAAAGLA